MFKVGIGQDSHRIQEPANGKALVLGGVTLLEKYGPRREQRFGRDLTCNYQCPFGDYGETNFGTCRR